MTRSAVVDRRLEAIAGSPVVSAVARVGAHALGVMPAADCTIYHVFNDPTPTTFSGLHEARPPRGYRSMWGQPAGVIEPGRFNLADSVTGAGATQAVGAGWHVHAYSMRRATMNQAQRLDAGARVTLNNNGAALDYAGLTFTVGSRDGVANVDLQTAFIGLWPVWHDDATMVAVMRWLANRYGVSPPPL